MGIDAQCLDPWIYWGLENGYILPLSCHFSHISCNSLILELLLLIYCLVTQLEERQDKCFVFSLMHPVFKIMDWFPLILRGSPVF